VVAIAVDERQGGPAFGRAFYRLGLCLFPVVQEDPVSVGIPVKRQQYGRRRIIAMPFDALAQLLKGEIKVIEGMPADAEIVTVNPITMFAMAEIVIESESFEPLNPGDVIPRADWLLQTVCGSEIVEAVFPEGAD
jgi:hypothetical protein